MQRPFLTHAHHAKGAHRGVADDIMAIEQVRSFHSLRVLCASTAPDMSSDSKKEQSHGRAANFAMPRAGAHHLCKIQGTRCRTTRPIFHSAPSTGTVPHLAMVPVYCADPWLWKVRRCREPSGRLCCFFRRSKGFDRLLLQRVEPTY